MPELNQLLDTLVSDVSARTRAPGAPAAIIQANRRRRRIASAVAAGAVAVIAVGGGVAAETLSGGDADAPVGEPTLGSPESPAVQESPTGAVAARESFEAGVRTALAQAEAADGWAVAETTLVEVLPRQCVDGWLGNAGGSFGSSRIRSSNGSTLAQVSYWRPAVPESWNVVARLVETLKSCTTGPWRFSEPIAQTDTVLAASAEGVIWIRQVEFEIVTLEVPTADGPPPLDIQVDVAEALSAAPVG